jgi:hypothetical protein
MTLKYLQLETVGTLTTSVNERPVFDDLKVSSAPLVRQESCGNRWVKTQTSKQDTDKCKQIK